MGGGQSTNQSNTVLEGGGRARVSPALGVVRGGQVGVGDRVRVERLGSVLVGLVNGHCAYVRPHLAHNPTSHPPDHPTLNPQVQSVKGTLVLENDKGKGGRKRQRRPSVRAKQKTRGRGWDWGRVSLCQATGRGGRIGWEGGLVSCACSFGARVHCQLIRRGGGPARSGNDLAFSLNKLCTHPPPPHPRPRP